MELLDIIDEKDQIIGCASRDDVYRQLLSHRIVHILVFNKNGEMILQKRSPKVSFCPGHWSTAAGGHVLTGEDYETAARREYLEELGVKSDLKFVEKIFYDVPNTPNKFLAIFETRFDGTFNCESMEVSEIRPFCIKDIKNMVDKGEKFHPELKFILEKYYF